MRYISSNMSGDGAYQAVVAQQFGWEVISQHNDYSGRARYLARSADESAEIPAGWGIDSEWGAEWESEIIVEWEDSEPSRGARHAQRYSGEPLIKGRTVRHLDVPMSLTRDGLVSVGLRRSTVYATMAEAMAAIDVAHAQRVADQQAEWDQWLTARPQLG